MRWHSSRVKQICCCDFSELFDAAVVQESLSVAKLVKSFVPLRAESLDDFRYLQAVGLRIHIKSTACIVRPAGSLSIVQKPVMTWRQAM